ncbi:MAG: hypothetical protein DYG94_02140 [Leptolyngbya sp. PLA3]|nr:MAG: hypothetical protein EDM82_02415 [Cyanobacteria bacterium CYA]MCE7967532.1 hypothetical protein [Leptolyngbya sp. PL-A3]
MTGSISNLAGSVSGAHNASRLGQADKSRDAARKDKAKPSAAHTHDVVELEHADAVRTLKDQTQEEAQEDRQEHPSYGAHGQANTPAHPRLDVKG